MPWIKVVDEEEADGLLARIYEETRKRAGRVTDMLKAQSSNPSALRSMIQLYQAVVLGDSPLTRAQREMLAVAVSRINNCHY